MFKHIQDLSYVPSTWDPDGFLINHLYFSAGNKMEHRYRQESLLISSLKYLLRGEYENIVTVYEVRSFSSFTLSTCVL